MIARLFARFVEWFIGDAFDIDLPDLEIDEEDLP